MKNRHRPPEIRARPFDEAINRPQITNLLTSDQQALIQSVSTLVQFTQGENPIYLEGEKAAFIYVVTKGLVRISRCGPRGKRQVISLKLPGDVFGFPELGLYANTATAMGEVSLYRIAWSRLKELLHLDPQLQTSLLVRMAFDLRQAQNRILILGQQNVTQRLASFFLELMEHADFYKPAQKHLYVPMSRYDLADYLGTAAETVVRAIAKMEEDGLICRLSSKLLLVPDPAGLTSLLQQRRRNG